ncbi:MAG: hypothetical protein KJ622_18030, partial [Alphaproteobacteria bacterium]|nr:hypothetical protein [Alphaproteobacteria bacterium]
LAVPITQGPQRTTIDTQTGTSKSSTGYHPGQQRRHGATRHAWRTKKKMPRREGSGASQARGGGSVVTVNSIALSDWRNWGARPTRPRGCVEEGVGRRAR